MKYLSLIIIFYFLAACSSGDSPSNQWEMAVQGVYSASLSSDGKHVLIGSIHHGGSYWSVDDFERLYNWNHKADTMSGIVASSISDNGLYAATSDHRKIVLWNAKTGEAFWLWEAPADIRDMDLSNTGQYALLGLESYEAALFDIKNGGVKLRLAHEGIVQTVDMSADGKWAITGGDDSYVKVWDLQSGKEIRSWELNNQIRVVAISEDGALGFGASHRGETHIWDLVTGKIRSQIKATSGYFLAARFNVNYSELLTGNSSGKVQLWDTNTGELKRTWKISGRNDWATKNTQVIDVAFSTESYRAVGANGITYDLQ
ncbi:MAG: WD40 repeat protein [Psychrobacter glaciei]|jgi:WD40 repeat protein